MAAQSKQQKRSKLRAESNYSKLDRERQANLPTITKRHQAAKREADYQRWKEAPSESRQSARKAYTVDKGEAKSTYLDRVEQERVSGGLRRGKGD